MNYIKEYVDIVFENHQKDWDTVLVITGKNRKGKTNLGLWLLHLWIEKKYGEVLPEHAEKYIGIDISRFSRVLEKAKKMDCVMDDEAGDISSRGSMTKSNRLLTQNYQIIAGENLLTILILPEIWYLDPYFRKDRIKHIFYVYERGRTAFWEENSKDKIIDINQNYDRKNMFVVYPDFFETFPKYKGPLLEPYLKMKGEKMKNVRTDLRQQIDEQKGTRPGIGSMTARRNKAVKQMMKDGLSKDEIADKLGVHRVTIGKAIQAIKVDELLSGK